jgi:hypothetical protein
MGKLDNRNAAVTVAAMLLAPLATGTARQSATGPIADETQTYRFRGDEQSRIIDCEFAIHAAHGPITIGDTKEGTFAIRVVKALDSPPGQMVNANGASGEKAIWGKRAQWVDCYGRVAGEDVGLAIFDHPPSFPRS